MNLLIILGWLDLLLSKKEECTSGACGDSE